MGAPLSMGVEEEYLLVDAESFVPRGRNGAVLRGAHAELGAEVQPELFSAEVESATPVCSTLDEVRAAVRERRCVLDASARRAGCRLAAIGSHPFAEWRDEGITPKERYSDLTDQFQMVARETLICGQHVHVGIDAEELRIEVLNRVRPWLSLFTALTANSPFWLGMDSGYASYRIEVFRRWPTNAVPRRFVDWAEYQGVVDALVSAGAITDASKLYWDVRPSLRFPTLEFRASDVNLRVEEAVTIAGLVRGLAAACIRDAQSGVAAPDPHPEVLEAAMWQAARHGLAGDLIDPVANIAVPASDRVDALLDFVGPDLDACGDRAVVERGVDALVHDGTGADRQRKVFAATGSLVDVVSFAVDETVADC